MRVVFCIGERKAKLSHKLNYLLILIRECRLTSHTGNNIVFLNSYLNLCLLKPFFILIHYYFHLRLIKNV